MREGLPGVALSEVPGPGRVRRGDGREAETGRAGAQAEGAAPCGGFSAGPAPAARCQAAALRPAGSRRSVSRDEAAAGLLCPVWQLVDCRASGEVPTGQSRTGGVTGHLLSPPQEHGARMVLCARRN